MADILRQYEVKIMVKQPLFEGYDLEQIFVIFSPVSIPQYCM